MSYLVLARKYRPQTFEEMVGQEHVTRTLANAIARGRIHHAFLFAGARGVGKTTAARILAKALCCEKGPTATPCDACDACAQIRTGNALDVVEIDGASNNGVDNIRELRDGARYQPARLRRKIYILDEVHMLSTGAFNALLKTLEEPPPHVTFIFATTEVHKIPITILSRCQRYDFKLLPADRLRGHLAAILAKESIVVEPGALALVTREAGGSVRDALSLLDQVIAFAGGEPLTEARVAESLGVADRATLHALARAVLNRDARTALMTLDAACERGDELIPLLRAFLGTVRDLQVARLIEDSGPLLDAPPGEVEELRALAKNIPDGLLPLLFDRTARAVEEAARSQTPRLIAEMALLDLVSVEPMLPLGDVLERLEAMEGRLAGGGGAPPTTEPLGVRQAGSVSSRSAPGGGGAAGRAAPAAPAPAEQAAPLAPATPPGLPEPGGAPDEAQDGRSDGAAGSGDARLPAGALIAAFEESVGKAARPQSSLGRAAAGAPYAKPASYAPDVRGEAATTAAPTPVVERPPLPPGATPMARWGNVLARLEAVRPALAANLALARLVALGPESCEISFPPGSLQAALLSETENRKALEQALGQELGVTPAVRIAPSGAAPGEAESIAEIEERRRREERSRREREARAHPVVQAAVRLFDAEIKEVKVDEP